MSYAVRAAGIGKQYAINQAARRADSLRDLVAEGISRLTAKALARETAGRAIASRAAAPKPQSFWALKDVSFEVAEGERVGIIGANGAGKSTLLKILSRVVTPTEGHIELRGRVASLLEVGTGFHPDLSGRENIFLNGAILGMSRQEVRRKFDQIVDFSEVGDFLDTPVKFYSSGMYVRLAFSVSASLDPDILIVDEVLAVGDYAFQQKCVNRVKELTTLGCTVLFVSHSMATVNALCQKALYLANGRLVAFETKTGAEDEEGKPSLVSAQRATVEYIRNVTEQLEHRRWHRAEYDPRDTGITLAVASNAWADCLFARICSTEGQATEFPRLDRPFVIELGYRLRRNAPHPMIPNFHVYDELGTRVFMSTPECAAPSEAGSYVARCIIAPFTLNTGRFSVGLALSTYAPETIVHFDAQFALRFEIMEDGNGDPRRHGWHGMFPGVTRPRLAWDIHTRSQ
jgi:lipopolysaccharide transport system ATP-binding protein